MERDPLAASEPLQPPEAVQEVALLEDQIKLVPLPLVTVLGVATKLTVGAAAVGAAAVTVMVADCDATAPPFVQVSVYVALLANATVACDPLGDLVPDHAPEATQFWARVLFHCNMAVPPLLMVLGVAVRLTVGSMFFTVMVAVCVAVPWGPVQVKV